MNSIKRRIVLIMLVIGGIACIVAALTVPGVAPVLAPVGGVLLTEAFGMFQSVITPTNNQENQNPRPNDTEQANAEEAHVEHNISLTNSPVNILFMLDRTRANEAFELEDPRTITRPHRSNQLLSS